MLEDSASRPDINRLAIVGGTHGNEFTGIYLLRRWQAHPDLILRSSFSTETLFANPEAFKTNQRYLHSDLNRQFKSKSLADPALTNYEQSRAKAINAHLGPKGNSRTDFVIDLHNTTSNMGPTLLIVQEHPLYHQLAGYLKLKMPEVVIALDDAHKPAAEHHLLCTLGTFGVIVEVGPQAQSVIRHDIMQQAETMTTHILDFIELWNQDQLPQLPAQVEAYQFTESLTLPIDEQGERLGMVHKDVEGHDFLPLKPGDALFETFEGETLYYQGAETVYPSFINEAAYYDNNLAMSLNRKILLEVYQN